MWGLAQKVTTNNTIILLILGTLPSIIWLILFLTKDPRPEPKYLIAKVFLFGIIIAPLVALMEAVVSEISNVGLISKTIIFLVWVAFIEEYMKYWVVKTAVISRPDFDEPPDAIIYMIAAALGFAAMENILIVFKVFPAEGLGATVGTISLRFTGATLLHALASGIVGYFLGLAWFFYHFKKQLIALGIILAAILHLLFNSLIFLSPDSALPNTSLLLLGMLIFLLFLFDKLRERHQQIIQETPT